MPHKGIIKGYIHIPGDKSISHRSIILSSLAFGKSHITNFLSGEDCLKTIQAFREMGVSIQIKDDYVIVNSQGAAHLKEPKRPLDFGNSGTTARLMLGVLAGLPFYSVAFGDPYLTERPMKRVVEPIQKMNGKIYGRLNGGYLPISIVGGQLSGICYKLPVKSAQVKSAVLLAGVFAEGRTTIIESTKTRDHTENMLKAFGADIEIEGNEVTITNKNKLTAHDIIIPGDISSAAFLLVAGLIKPGSKLILKRVGLNKTRTGILDVFTNMGASFEIHNIEEFTGERFGDITVTYGSLNGTTISGDLIPRLIDELPIIALLATQANGKTIIRDAEELRLKETDRIKAVADVLTNLGATVETFEDGMVIEGNQILKGGSIKSYHDHRIAMMGAIASLITKDSVTIDSIDSIKISYPSFFKHLNEIKQVESTEL